MQLKWILPLHISFRLFNLGYIDFITHRILCSDFLLSEFQIPSLSFFLWFLWSRVYFLWSDFIIYDFEIPSVDFFFGMFSWEYLQLLFDCRVHSDWISILGFMFILTYSKFNFNFAGTIIHLYPEMLTFKLHVHYC